MGVIVRWIMLMATQGRDTPSFAARGRASLRLALLRKPWLGLASQCKASLCCEDDR